MLSLLRLRVLLRLVQRQLHFAGQHLPADWTENTLFRMRTFVMLSKRFLILEGLFAKSTLQLLVRVLDMFPQQHFYRERLGAQGTRILFLPRVNLQMLPESPGVYERLWTIRTHVFVPLGALQLIHVVHSHVFAEGLRVHESARAVLALESDVRVAVDVTLEVVEPLEGLLAERTRPVEAGNVRENVFLEGLEGPAVLLTHRTDHRRVPQAVHEGVAKNCRFSPALVLIFVVLGVFALLPFLLLRRTGEHYVGVNLVLVHQELVETLLRVRQVRVAHVISEGFRPIEDLVAHGALELLVGVQVKVVPQVLHALVFYPANRTDSALGREIQSDSFVFI